MNSPLKLVLSLDIGTTALKVGLFSVTGELVSMETLEQKLLFPKPGYVEQSLQKSWELITQSVRSIMKNHSPRLVVAIALSIQRGSVVPIDEYGEPLSEQIVWMDNRGIPYVDWLHQNVGLENYYNTAGHGLTHITGVTKLLSLRNSNPKQWNMTKVVAPPQTVFLKWLGCDELVCDESCGSYTFPLDLKKKIWSQELSSKLDFPLEKLPKLVTSIEIVGKLSVEAAQVMGLNPGTFLVAGGGDGQCAAAGSGVISSGMCMINIGTGTGVQSYLPNFKLDPNCMLSVAAHVVPEAWEMEGHTQASGAVFRWLRDEFGQSENKRSLTTHEDPFDLLVDQARFSPPGAEGLLLIPNFNGSTTPIVELDSRGMLLGLTLSHERKHVIRAFLEGISTEIRWLLDSIIVSDVPITEIRLVGGGAKNQFWNQIHADIFKKSIKTLQITDSALVGAAMCAAVAVGEYSDLSEAANNFVHIKETIDPNPKNFEVYDLVYENYIEVFDLFRKYKIFNRLKNQSHLSHNRMEYL